MLKTSDVPLQAEGLSVRYGDHHVLQGVDLAVRPGEIYALLGGNGAGKSTLINAFLGFVTPSGGQVRVSGFDPAADPAAARAHIGYLPENVALYEHLTAIENAEYFLTLGGRRPAREEVERVLGQAGLDPGAWDRRLGGFSKGMRQKVAIAIALLRHVPVLLLDEPTSGLDPRSTADFNLLMRDLGGRDVAILMVTHDLMSAVDVADRIGFLDQGRIAREASASGAERFDLRELHRQFLPAEAA
ncbi:MAG TPA: ABC transporter ATP-binding protein [Sphingomicrobium sp.]|nr:ABC transporter ATP-binding protein [Sphingomicrobium sp.]